MNWRLRAERKFESFSDLVFENSKKIVVVILLLVVAFGSQLSQLTMDISPTSFFV